MKPRRVDFFNHNEDFECAFLGALGFSTRYIQNSCRNLSAGQVGYRLKKAGIRRIDYRDGTSDFARIMIKTADFTIRTKLTKQLKQHTNGKNNR